MAVIFRNLQMEEAQAFWDMMNLLDGETKFMMYEPGERAQLGINIPRLQSMIKNSLEGSDFLMIGECDGTIAGFLSAGKGNLKRVAHTAYVVIGVREAFQGWGIGTELFKLLEKWAGEKSITRLELTVMCPNAPAVKLYQRNGFVIEGIRKNSMLVDGEYVDEYYMAKLLQRGFDPGKGKMQGREIGK